ncbi:MAG: PepSY domain-containing protein [Acidobacteriota bacterium]|nr:PepSY domain-containing protein [Acidobacteriota bacterium]
MLAVLALVLMAAACASRSGAGEISRERAIEIARPQASFPIRRVETEKTVSDGHPVWRVTLQGDPPATGSPLRETVIVEVDRISGSVVSVAKS